MRDFVTNTIGAVKLALLVVLCLNVLAVTYLWERWHS